MRSGEGAGAGGGGGSQFSINRQTPISHFYIGKLTHF